MYSVFFSIGLPADELVVFDVHRERAARGDIAGENGSCQQRFHAALEIPAQRTRAVERIVAALDDKLLRPVGDAELERAIGQTLSEPFDHDVDDAGEVVFRERLEEDHLIETVQKLRAERAVQLAHDGALRRIGDITLHITEAGRVLLDVCFQGVKELFYNITVLLRFG